MEDDPCGWERDKAIGWRHPESGMSVKHKNEDGQTYWCINNSWRLHSHGTAYDLVSKAKNRVHVRQAQARLEKEKERQLEKEKARKEEAAA